MRLWLAQGTIGLEVLEDGGHFDTVLVPVGGGGLIGGIAVAVKSLAPATRIVGVEAARYPGMTNALRGAEPAPAATGTHTIAEGIAVKEPGVRNLQIARDLIDDMVLVDEEHLERAITLLADVEKTVAEGAGAAALAALLAHPQRFAGQRVALVLSGGNIDTRLFANVLTRSLVREQRLTRIRIVGDDRPGILAQVARVLGDNDANIIEVRHDRMSLDIPAKGSEFDILIETRDSQHTNQVNAALGVAGFLRRPVPGDA